MATSWTLTTLKTALKNHVEDQGTEFSDNLNTIIQLAEDRTLKALPLTIFDGRGNVSIAAAGQTPNKPTGCILTHEISYISSSVTYHLYPRRYSFLRAYCPNTTQAAPKYFADDYAEDKYWIAPVPNLTVTAEALMTLRPASITAGSTSWLGSNVGDLLFAACMMGAEQFTVAWDEAKAWEVIFARRLADAQRDFARLLRRPYMP